MTRLSPIGFLLASLITAVWGLPVLSWAQDGAVLSVRAGRAVVDASALEDVEPGMKLGFVREDGGERTEIGQGEVLQVKDGKATVKLKPNSGVKKGDFVVACPDPDDDPYAELRDVVDELQGQAKAQPRAPRSAKIRTLTREAVSALEARDQAVADGKCDVAEHDERVSEAAAQLAALSKSRESSRADGRAAPGAPAARGARAAPEDEDSPRARSRGERPSTKAEEQEEEEPKAKPGTREIGRTPEPTRETPGPGARDKSGVASALDIFSRVVKALPTESKRGATEEAPAEGVEERDSVQSTVDLIGKLTDAIPKKKKRSRRGQEAPPAARVEPSPGSEESAPRGWAPPATVEPAEEKAAPPEEKRPPRTSRVTPPARSDTAEPGGQTKPLILRGRVVNSKGEPVAGAQVVSGEVSVVTNVEGFFRLGNLKAGQHEISVTAPGFNPRKRVVSLEAGRMPPVTFVLRRE